MLKAPRERLERGLMRGYSTLASTTTAMPPTREHYPQMSAQVISVANLSPAFRRVTLQAAELTTIECTGPDEYIGLYMPRPGIELVLPEYSDNPRRAVADLPEEVRPDLRWYTIREHRRDQGCIDIDIVSSGHDGPGARWLRSVRVGDEVGVRVQASLYAAADSGGHHLLIADETGLPGLLAVLEHHHRLAAGTRPTLTVIAEAPTSDHVYPEVRKAGIEVHLRGKDPPGSALLRVLREHTDPVDFAWICAEGSAVAATKHHLIRQRGVSRRSMIATGFWRLGHARP